MKRKRNNVKWWIVLLLCLGSINFSTVYAQEINQTLSFTEFLGYVKKYHPRVKQAGLEIGQAEAELMKARGAFDPKLEVDFDKKEFKGKEYYSLLNSSFKIPTWYGIEVKAGFDNSEGIYVNPQNSLPNSGLTSLGISIPLGQGLLINQRMADLRIAKINLSLSAAEQRLQAANVIYDASVAYFNWLRAHEESNLYAQYLRFAETRYEGIKKLIVAGDKPGIDSIEAGIIVKNRRFNFKDAGIKLMKTRQELSNYLWIDNVPLELQDNIAPEIVLDKSISQFFSDEANAVSNNLDGHPKITALESKLGILQVERKLKQNALLPKIDLGYYYLSEPSLTDNYNFKDYKVGLNFSFPLFLRKERGSLKAAQLKIQDAKLELDIEKLQLKNKIEASRNEIKLLQEQFVLTESLVTDYRKMLESEERLFSFGESSIFLLNTRENSLVSVGISAIELKNRYLNSYAMLFKVLAEIPVL
ncbi:TolC family protein [Flavobacterium sp.]|uniref:TolC family protein n=1 Tax=Flavobacterium sp. TaxID=239 RepID=UPI002605149B|nr:TolC family protein [Flavobacterium sp.]